MYVVMTQECPEGYGFRMKKQAIKYAKEYAQSHPKTESSVYQITEAKINLIGKVYGNPRNPNLFWVEANGEPLGERALRIEPDGNISEIWS